MKLASFHLQQTGQMRRDEKRGEEVVIEHCSDAITLNDDGKAKVRTLAIKTLRKGSLRNDIPGHAVVRRHDLRVGQVHGEQLCEGDGVRVVDGAVGRVPSRQRVAKAKDAERLVF